jgi:hypothetical protein
VESHLPAVTGNRRSAPPLAFGFLADHFPAFLNQGTEVLDTDRPRSLGAELNERQLADANEMVGSFTPRN